MKVGCDKYRAWTREAAPSSGCLVWSRSQMTFIQYPVKTAWSKVTCLSSDHPSPQSTCPHHHRPTSRTRSHKAEPVPVYGPALFSDCLCFRDKRNRNRTKMSNTYILGREHCVKSRFLAAKSLRLTNDYKTLCIVKLQIKYLSELLIH